MSYGRALALFAIVCIAACGGGFGKRCKGGTLLLDLRLAPSIANADHLRISVSVAGGGAPTVTTVPHGDKAEGTLQVNFAPYPAGETVTVDIVAIRGQVEIGAGHSTVMLPPSCGTAKLELFDQSSFTDLAGIDFAGLDLAGVDFLPPPADLAVVETCKNGQLDDGETDTDCGGVCLGCAVGKSCLIDTDCESKVCSPTTMKCVASRCENGTRDGVETDIDCGGGTCAGCDVGKACGVANDCGSKLCNAAKMLCVATTCEDGVIDGTETDLDCGGSCAQKCKVGQSCLSNSDCISPSACDGTHHCGAAQCNNGVVDVDNPGATPPVSHETDQDCGGAVCGPCATGKKCEQNSDCTSGFCNTKTKFCVATQCEDGIVDGSESDVDCGGSCPARCGTNQMCSGSSDCNVNAVCSPGKLCCIPNCSGKVCGSDGCGGSCGSCGATTPTCNTSQTACQCTSMSCGAGFTCTGGTCVCATGTGENCFDGIDNNCDGLIDCADPKCTPTAECVPTAPNGFAYGQVANQGACPGGLSAATMYESVYSPPNCTCGSCSPTTTCTTDVYSQTTCGDPASTTVKLATVTATLGQTNANGHGPCVGPLSYPNQVYYVQQAAVSSCGNPTPSKPALSFSYKDFCSTNTIGGGCSAGNVCVPKGNRCVKGTGACVGNVSTSTFYGSYSDPRTCSACTGCTVQTPGNCNYGPSAGLTFHTDTACGPSGSGPGQNPFCSGTTSYHSMSEYIFDAAKPTCGGTPTSTANNPATLNTPISVCCN